MRWYATLKRWVLLESRFLISDVDLTFSTTLNGTTAGWPRPSSSVKSGTSISTSVANVAGVMGPLLSPSEPEESEWPEPSLEEVDKDGEEASDSQMEESFELVMVKRGTSEI